MTIGYFNGNIDYGLVEVISKSNRSLFLVNVNNSSSRNLPKKVIISPSIGASYIQEQYKSLCELIENNPLYRQIYETLYIKQKKSNEDHSKDLLKTEVN